MAFSTPTNQFQEPQPSFFKEYWYIFFLGGVFLLFCIAYVLRALTPAPKPEFNTWNQLQPGYTTLDEVTTRLGKPLSSEETPLGTERRYTSSYPSLPNRVITNDNEIVTFIKEYLPYDENNVLKTYTDQFGEPDITLFDLESGDASTAYVFLNQGVVIVAYNENNVVDQKWYFVPTTRENFLASWGQNLSDLPRGPEFAIDDIEQLPNSATSTGTTP